LSDGTGPSGVLSILSIFWCRATAGLLGEVATVAAAFFLLDDDLVQGQHRPRYSAWEWGVCGLLLGIPPPPGGVPLTLDKWVSTGHPLLFSVPPPGLQKTPARGGAGGAPARQSRTPSGRCAPAASTPSTTPPPPRPPHPPRALAIIPSSKKKGLRGGERKLGSLPAPIHPICWEPQRGKPGGEFPKHFFFD